MHKKIFEYEKFSIGLKTRVINVSYIFNKRNSIIGLPLFALFFFGGGIGGINHKIQNSSNYIGDIRLDMYGSGHSIVIEESVVIKKANIWFEDYNYKLLMKLMTK